MTKEYQKEVLSALRGARKLLAQPRGWCKNDAHRGKAHCATGAVSVVCRVPTLDTAIYWLNSAVPMGYSGIVDYNDTPTVRKAQVLRVFDKAIKAVQRAAQR